MNVAIDIGNTSIKKSLFLNNKLSKITFLNYNKKDLNPLIKFLKKDIINCKDIYICSVVPEVNKFINKYFIKLKSKVYYINKQKLGFLVEKKVDLDQVGSDRIINVLGVNNIYKKYLWIIIENEYPNKVIKKDTFFEEANYSRFGVLANNVGRKKIEGTIVEKTFLTERINEDSLTAYMVTQKKYFEKEVYVKDTIDY